MKETRLAFLATVLLLPLAAAVAQKPPLELASPFVDDMILQRGMKVPVWGWAKPGSKVTVAFAGQDKTVTVGVGEIEGADMNVRAPYAQVLPLAKMVYTPEMIAAARASQPEAEEGVNAAPDYLVELHNRLAVLTQ